MPPLSACSHSPPRHSPRPRPPRRNLQETCADLNPVVDAAIDEQQKSLLEATLVSLVGQTLTRGIDVRQLDTEGKPVNRNERVIPDLMERTLTLENAVSTQDYALMTVMLENTPADFASPPGGLTDAVAERWWHDRSIVKLDLVQVTEAPGGTRNLRIRVPQRTSAYGPLWPIETVTFAVIACPKAKVDQKEPLVYASTRAVSDRKAAAIATVLVTLAFWLLAGWAFGRPVLATCPRPNTARPPAAPAARLADRTRRLLDAMDPVVITQDSMGFGSTSRLQVFFFTLIVVATLTYVFLRAGYLSEISDNLLYLLGIAGLSSTASKIVANNRAAADDAFTIRTDRWLRRHGIVFPLRQPQWRDLLITGNEFNIYNFQALVFSVLVGFWILSSAMQNLAELAIPNNLMVLLGLSQALYVGGKAVGSGESRGRAFNVAVDQAIAAETRLLAPVSQDHPFRHQAVERDFNLGLGQPAPAPLEPPPPEASTAMLEFQKAASCAVSYARALNEAVNLDKVQPVDPPDDTYSQAS